MLAYKSLSLIDKFRFMFDGRTSVLGAINDYINDNDLYEIKTANSRGQQVNVHYEVTYGVQAIQNMISVYVDHNFFGCYLTSTIERLFTDQGEGREVLIRTDDCDNRLCGNETKVEFVFVDRSALKRAIEVHNRFDKAGVIKLYNDSTNRDLQFQVINNLGIEKYFFDRFNNLRNNYGWTKCGHEKYNM